MGERRRQSCMDTPHKEVCAVRIAIITAPRKTSYLQATIASLISCMGSTKAVELGVFSDSLPCDLSLPVGVQSWFRQQTDLDRIRSLGLYGTSNLQRALRWSSSGRYACVFEDDVLFADDWLYSALQIADKLNTVGTWCLSLQHFLPINHFTKVVDVERYEVFRWNGIVPLFGSQGYLMPSSTALAVADMYEKKIRETRHVNDRRYWMMDEGMIRFCSILRMFSLYVPHPCLIQHVGKESSVFPWETLGPHRTTRYFPKR